MRDVKSFRPLVVSINVYRGILVEAYSAYRSYAEEFRKTCRQLKYLSGRSSSPRSNPTTTDSKGTIH